MIKTTELRLNNIVSVNKGFEMYVSAIFKDTVYLDFEGNQGDVWEEKEEDVFPIPLTEEWLIKFGFINKLGNYELENFRFHVNKPFNYDGFLFCEGYSVITDKIHFVHQFQNLYFAFTNEELTIKNLKNDNQEP